MRAKTRSIGRAGAWPAGHWKGRSPCAGVDGREGLMGGDREIAQAVPEAGKQALLAVNKIDDRRSRSGSLEMYQLGFEPVFEIAAEHGDGVGDLLDAIVTRCQRPEAHLPPQSLVKCRSRSLVVRMWASPHWSIGCSEKNA